MSDSEILLQAAINRIAARLTEKFSNSAKDFTEITEQIPQRLKEEWSSFKEEVIEESERLEKKTTSSNKKHSKEKQTKENIIQTQIENLRSKVMEINKNIEEKN